MGEFSAVWCNAELLKLGPRFRGGGLGVWRRPLKHRLPLPHPTASCQFPAVGSGL